MTSATQPATTTTLPDLAVSTQDDDDHRPFLTKPLQIKEEKHPSPFGFDVSLQSAYRTTEKHGMVLLGAGLGPSLRFRFSDSFGLRTSLRAQYLNGTSNDKRIKTSEIPPFRDREFGVPYLSYTNIFTTQHIGGLIEGVIAPQLHVQPEIGSEDKQLFYAPVLQVSLNQVANSVSTESVLEVKQPDDEFDLDHQGEMFLDYQNTGPDVSQKNGVTLGLYPLGMRLGNFHVGAGVDVMLNPNSPMVTPAVSAAWQRQISFKRKD